MHKADDREGWPKEAGANPEHGTPVRAKRARTAAEITLMVELCCDEWNVRKCEGKCKLCVLFSRSSKIAMIRNFVSSRLSTEEEAEEEAEKQKAKSGSPC
jgi:hypothetical protein